MSTKSRTIKEPKIQVQEPADTIPVTPLVADKPKRTRAPRKKPSKDETINMLDLCLQDLRRMLSDLKEDEQKLTGLQLLHLPTLINVTKTHLEEDIKEVEERSARNFRIIIFDQIMNLFNQNEEQMAEMW